MQDLDRLFDKNVAEIERLINTRTVVGEPITVAGNTLIPLVSVGFGFGGGGGDGSEAKNGSGHGFGAGGGGGVKPVAVIVIGADGVRVEGLKSGTASVLEKVAESIGTAVKSKRTDAND